MGLLKNYIFQTCVLTSLIIAIYYVIVNFVSFKNVHIDNDKYVHNITNLKTIGEKTRTEQTGDISTDMTLLLMDFSEGLLFVVHIQIIVENIMILHAFWLF